MERKIKVLMFALFILGINSLATGEEPALGNKEAVERFVRLEEGQKKLGEGQKVLEQGQKELSARLTKVEEGQKALEQGQKVLEKGQQELSARLTNVEKEQKILGEGQKILLAKFEEWQKGINNRIDDLKDDLNKRIDDLKDLIYVLLAGILALIGFVLWDRRSTISPVIKKTKELDERDDLLLKVLKEYAVKEPKMAEVLKSFGLL